MGWPTRESRPSVLLSIEVGRMGMAIIWKKDSYLLPLQHDIKRRFRNKKNGVSSLHISCRCFVVDMSGCFRLRFERVIGGKDSYPGRNVLLSDNLKINYIQ